MFLKGSPSPYIENKQIIKQFRQRQRLREAQDFDALEKNYRKRRKLSIRKDAYLKKSKTVLR